MGRDERVNEAKRDLGRFNVHIDIYYTNSPPDHHDVRSWVHNGNFLALDFPNKERLEVICLANVYKFVITPQESLS